MNMYFFVALSFERSTKLYTESQRDSILELMVWLEHPLVLRLACYEADVLGLPGLPYKPAEGSNIM
jgi:hypothetical protein